MLDNYLQKLYQEHHKIGKREGFAIYKEKRGEFFSKNIGENKQVLDIGCRDGILTKYFLKNNQVTGIDIDKNLLDIAKKKGIKTIHKNLYEDWNIKEKYDIVVAAEILEHLYYPERILGKISKVLKPKGKILISTPNAYIFSSRIRFLLGQEIPAHFDPTHINLFSSKKISHLLSKNFKNIKITGITPNIYKPFHFISNNFFSHTLLVAATRK